MPVLSFNGVDGSGKTEQISLLKWRLDDRFHFTRPFTAYTDKWPRLDPVALSQWWFEELSEGKLIELMIEMVNGRIQDCQPRKINVVDRGIRMCQAVCAALWVMKEDIVLEDALARIKKRFDREVVEHEKEIEIFFEQDTGYFNSINEYRDMISSKPTRPRWMHERYATYQKNLKRALSLMLEEKDPTFKLKVDDCIVAIGDRLVPDIEDVFSISLGSILNHLKLMVGFGGYSESGKSSFAEYLRKNHGFARLKFRFFSQSLQSYGQEATPQAVCYEVLRYVSSHSFCDSFSLESLHGYKASAFLKLLLGSRYKVIFLDVPRETRIRRLAQASGINEAESAKIIDSKDNIKREAGSDFVKEKADIVIDNSEEIGIGLSTMVAKLGI